jgi:hypothetical protein
MYEAFVICIINVYCECFVFECMMYEFGVSLYDSLLCLGCHCSIRFNSDLSHICNDNYFQHSGIHV